MSTDQTGPRSLDERLEAARAKQAAAAKAADDKHRAALNEIVELLNLDIGNANQVIDDPSSTRSEMDAAFKTMTDLIVQHHPDLVRRGAPAPAPAPSRGNRPNPAPAGNGNRADNTAETPAVPPPSPAPQEQEGHGQESEVPHRTEATELQGRPRRTWRQTASRVADAVGLPPSTNRQH